MASLSSLVSVLQHVHVYLGQLKPIPLTTLCKQVYDHGTVSTEAAIQSHVNTLIKLQKGP